MNLLLKRLWIQISSDRKRLGALSVLLAVGLLLWARVLLVSKPPRTAVAEQNQQHVQASTDNNRDADAAQDTSDSTTTKSTRRIQLAEAPVRDPFVISIRYFPEPQLNDPSEKETKSPPEPSDNAIGKEARLRARLQSAVQSLRLEAVLSGTLAVINNETYRQGETVPVGDSQKFQLTLSEVHKRSVVLTYGDEQFELSMKSPTPR